MEQRQACRLSALARDGIFFCSPRLRPAAMTAASAPVASGTWPSTCKATPIMAKLSVLASGGLTGEATTSVTRFTPAKAVFAPHITSHRSTQSCTSTISDLPVSSRKSALSFLYRPVEIIRQSHVMIEQNHTVLCNTPLQLGLWQNIRQKTDKWPCACAHVSM